MNGEDWMKYHCLKRWLTRLETVEQIPVPPTAGFMSSDATKQLQKERQAARLRDANKRLELLKNKGNK